MNTLTNTLINAMTSAQLTSKLSGLKGVSVASARTITINVVDGTGLTNTYDSRNMAKAVLNELAEGWKIDYCSWGGCLLTSTSTEFN